MNVSEVAAAAFGIGVCCGLRCLTPICVLALMRVPVGGLFATVLYWPMHAYVFVAAALAELVRDKMPNCPSRLEPPGLIGRILFGGFCGGALAAAGGAAIWMGVVLGPAGAVAGAFAGNRFRGWAGARWKWPAALAEDLVAVGGSVLIASYFL